MLTSCTELLDSCDVVDGIPGSDHDGAAFMLTITKTPTTSQKRYSYNFKKANFDVFRNLLSMFTWNDCFLNNNVEDAWATFKRLATDKCIPKVMLSKKKQLNWLSEKSLKMIKKKRRAYKLCRSSKNDKDVTKYKRISNKVCRLTREDHCAHLDEITTNLHRDQRSFW